jgi:hypothetical protein
VNSKVICGAGGSVGVSTGRIVTVGAELAVLLTSGVGLTCVADCIIKGSDTTTSVGVGVSGMEVGGTDIGDMAVGGKDKPVSWHPLTTSQSTNKSAAALFICQFFITP